MYCCNICAHNRPPPLVELGRFFCQLWLLLDCEYIRIHGGPRAVTGGFIPNKVTEPLFLLYFSQFHRGTETERDRDTHRQREKEGEIERDDKRIYFAHLQPTRNIAFL